MPGNSALAADPNGKLQMPDNPAMNFPQRPATVTTKLSVGMPQITVPPNVAMALGGADAGQLLKAPFENLLHNSGRFQVLMDKPGNFGVLGSVTYLKIDKGTNSSKGGWNPVSIFKKNVKAFAHLPEGMADMAAIDWSNNEAKFSIGCAVAIQLFDKTSSAMLDNVSCEVSKESTVKEFRAQAGGLDLTQAGPLMQCMTDYQTKIVEYALYQALLRMLPSLDTRLAAGDGTSSPANAAVQIPPPAAEPNPPAGSAKGEPTWLKPDEYAAKYKVPLTDVMKALENGELKKVKKVLGQWRISSEE